MKGGPVVLVVFTRAGAELAVNLAGALNGRVFEGRADLYTTNVGDKRVGCMLWRDIPLYYCDGVMLLENGSARDEEDLREYNRRIARIAGELGNLGVKAEIGKKEFFENDRMLPPQFME